MSKKVLLVILSFCLIATIIFLMGCSKDDKVVAPRGNTALKLRPTYLPTLTADDGVIYELWVGVVDTVRRVEILIDTTSLGKFFWDSERSQFNNTYGYERSDVFNLPQGKTTDDYNIMLLSIEQFPDSSAKIANNYIFRGNLIADYPILEIRIASEYSQSSTASGSYTLTTLSDNDLNANELSGIWFALVDEGATFAYANMRHSLLLPIFGEDFNFTYETWVYMQGWPAPISLGKFRNASYRDFNNRYLDNKYAPLIPGEDFLKNPPRGFAFPLQLVGHEGDSTAVFITLEPYPDPQPNRPFPLILLSRELPLLRPGELPDRKRHATMLMGNRSTTLPQIEVTRTTAVEE